MEQKYHDAIKKIVQLTKQDIEFDKELRKMLGVETSPNTVAIEDEKLSQIYEYCIEKNVRNQSLDFYSDFPVSALKSGLQEDFVKMEFYHRKDNFQEFCLALYQQIEAITNKLCENKDLYTITKQMWGDLAYVVNDYNSENFNREYSEKATYQIAKLIFGDKAYERHLVSLQSLYANEKMKVIVYFLGYKTMMKSSDYKTYIEITDNLSYIYNLRNCVHRGGSSTEWEQKILDKIMPLKSFYYFKFLGVLAQFIEFVKEGYDAIPVLKKYADSITVKPVKSDGPKILGTIDLPNTSPKKNIH